VERPRLLPTSATEESFGGITYHLDGELVPALTVDLEGHHSVYFEHHVLLWKHPGVIDFTFERVRGIANMLFGGTGFFIDKFHGASGDGILWLHGYGNVFEKVLGAHEMIDVEPGGWLYKDPHVRMETNLTRLATGFLAGTNIVMNRFCGPGRVAIQSMYLHMPTEE
jgi:uncharacterized protein (AIM24 family)